MVLPEINLRLAGTNLIWENAQISVKMKDYLGLNPSFW